MAWKRTRPNGTTFWEDKVYLPKPGGGYRQKPVRASTRAEVLRLKSQLLDVRDAKPTAVRRGKAATLPELGASFIDRHLPRVEPSTQEYWLNALRYRIAPFLYEDDAGRPRKLKDLDVDTIDEWIARLIADGQSPRVINAALSTLKTMLNKGIEWKLVDVNRALSVKKLAEATARPRIYTPDEVWRMAAGTGLRWTAAPERGKGIEHLVDVDLPAATRDRTMVAVKAFTGVRLGELLGLRWEDIEADWKWLRIDRQIKVVIDKETGKRGAGVAATKGKRERSVPILEPTRLALDWWWHAQGCPTRGYMFPNRRGGFLQPTVWRARNFKPAAAHAPDELGRIHVRKVNPRGKVTDATDEPAAFAKAKPHELRHTFASLMIALGVTPLRLASWLGHSETITTMRTYAHLFDRVEDDVVAKVNAHLFHAASAATVDSTLTTA